MKPCSVEGCGRIHYGRGLCSRHYDNRRRRNDFSGLPPGQSSLTDSERFWSKVDRSGGDGSCWEWRASRDGWGYGKFRLSGYLAGGTVRAHRYAFFLAYGAWPPDFALHSCDNPSCVNPLHIFCGTNDDNMRDMATKKRSPGGERHGRHKLSWQCVHLIRSECAQGTTQSEMAKRYGVDPSTISNVVRGKSW